MANRTSQDKRPVRDRDPIDGLQPLIALVAAIVALATAAVAKSPCRWSPADVLALTAILACFLGFVATIVALLWARRR